MPNEPPWCLPPVDVVNYPNVDAAGACPKTHAGLAPSFFQFDGLDLLLDSGPICSHVGGSWGHDEDGHVPRLAP